MTTAHDDQFGSLHLWLRDGVDVYVSPDSCVHFVFLSTRKRLRLKVAPQLVDSLEWLDGSASVIELETRYCSHVSGLDTEHTSSFRDFVMYLYDKGILVRKDWMLEAFSQDYVERYSRQLNFFLDIEESETAAVTLMKKIYECRVALIGIGAVGSWILRELVQIGFRRFVLVDPKNLKVSDRTRNAIFNHRLIGEPKVTVAKNYIHGQAIEPETRALQLPLDMNTNTEELIGSDIDLIINTADEPYIGATSIKLSRYCVDRGLPLLVAGGFDAHLASLSELIVPRKTPCSDCYATYFEKALRGWKPISHPVADRQQGFGGLPSLSTFAASAAVLKIVRLFAINGGDIDRGRGEFLFNHYDIDSFEVERNPACPTCGDPNLVASNEN